MAARSVTIKVENGFDIALVFDHDSLQHGIWGSNPPGRIEAGSTAQWVAESKGVATGTEGTVWYRLDIPGTTGLVRLHWDNPFVGSNNYDQSGPDVLTVKRVGDGSGDDSTAHWVIGDASTTGDGIPDAWKISGATIDPGDGSGPQFVDLPAMGATVGRPDIFVHLDWMEDPTHSHRPSDAAIRLVVDAFANAPYVARNGAVGINLHVDAGPTSIMNFATGATWGALSRAASVGHVTQLGTTTPKAGGGFDYDWDDFDKIKGRAGGLLKSGRAPIFRYAIAAHQTGSVGNSGVGRTTPGSDFIVSLGTFAAVTDMMTAGTFMHELGHALGLDHGGSDGINGKPNHLSVMNYVWQFSGIRRGGAFRMDYSSVALAVLNELALDETVGLGPGSAGYATSRFLPATAATPAGFVQVADASGPIDWNGDGVATNSSLAWDTNNDSVQTTLAPSNDWQILKLRGGAIGAGGYAPPPSTTLPDELTPAIQAMILPPDITPPQTTASVAPAPNPAGWNRTPVAVELAATDDISGVARTEYRLKGIGPVAYSAPVPITTEGVHDVAFRSIDRSQNVESERHLTVRIDMTAPEVVVWYDPTVDDIVVEGRDFLSGVTAGPVPPSSRFDVEWTSFGSDAAELRIYDIRDRADNATTLFLKVRCSPVAWEASVLAIVYDDHIHGQNQDAAAQRERMAALAAGAEVAEPRDARRTGDRNTMVFERLTGRDAAKALLGVRQVVAIGEGGARRVVKTRWDALDDYSIVVRESGTGSCAPCRETRPTRDQEEREREREEREREREEREREQEEREREQEERNGRSRDVRASGSPDWPIDKERSLEETRPIEEQPPVEETRPVEEDCGCNGASESDDSRDDRTQDPSPAHEGPCGPEIVSETDIRGRVVLHVVSELGRLHVVE